ncbi:MAG: AmmeMemoRadiSam system protein A [Treponema sp.]|jgi:AmmeMemoRadiSam system protein A|nr:AmmeMemoRadiSam system protein A [Treponema sp.]
MSITLTDEEKKLLLAEAREIIAARLEKREPVLGPLAGEGTLAEHLGAFVTLHLKPAPGGKPILRGCIGRILAAGPLRECVREMAPEAAFGDPRFYPLTLSELPQCRIEISVLSKIEPCPDPETVRVGVHGLFLLSEEGIGVLLPQVPVEQGWDRRQFLDHLCLKAGAPLGTFKKKNAELFTFTAEVFGEEEAGHVPVTGRG